LLPEAKPGLRFVAALLEFLARLNRVAAGDASTCGCVDFSSKWRTVFLYSWRILELHAGARTTDGSFDEGQETASRVPVNVGVTLARGSGHSRLVEVAR
jgi:hypothetical protein